MCVSIWITFGKSRPKADCLFHCSRVQAAMDRMGRGDQYRPWPNLPSDCGQRHERRPGDCRQLVTRHGFSMEVGYLHATRYRNKLSGGELFWKRGSEHSLVGSQRVLIVERYSLDEKAIPWLRFASYIIRATRGACQGADCGVASDKRMYRKAYKGNAARNLVPAWDPW